MFLPWIAARAALPMRRAAACTKAMGRMTSFPDAHTFRLEFRAYVNLRECAPPLRARPWCPAVASFLFRLPPCGAARRDRPTYLAALSIQGKTPSQWEEEGHKVAPSPPCMGGSKGDPSM